MDSRLKAALNKAISNISKDRNALCVVIKKIVDKIGNFKDAVEAIISVNNKISEKEIFTAYNIAIGNLIPNTWQVQRYEVVKFLAENADLDQQAEMFKNGVLVASPKYPEGHNVSLFNLKNCQIKYAWNFKNRRLFTDEERLRFAKQTFTGVSSRITPKVVDSVEGSVGVKNHYGHNEVVLSGSVLAKDLVKVVLGNKIKLRHFKNHKNAKDYYKDVIQVLKEPDATFRGVPRDVGPQNFAMDKHGNAVFVVEHQTSFLASEIDLILINLFALQLKKELSVFENIDKL